MVEEPHRKLVRDDRTSAGVMPRQNIGRPAGLDERVQTHCDDVQRFVPGDFFEAPFALRPGAFQWSRESSRRIAPYPVVGERSFATKRSPVCLLVGIPRDPVDLAVLENDADSATVVTIARTSRQNRCFTHNLMLLAPMKFLFERLFRRQPRRGQADRRQAFPHCPFFVGGEAANGRPRIAPAGIA